MSTKAPKQEKITDQENHEMNQELMETASEILETYSRLTKSYKSNFDVIEPFVTQIQEKQKEITSHCLTIMAVAESGQGKSYTLNRLVLGPGLEKHEYPLVEGKDGDDATKVATVLERSETETWTVSTVYCSAEQYITKVKEKSLTNYKPFDKLLRFNGEEKSSCDVRKRLSDLYNSLSECEMLAIKYIKVTGPLTHVPKNTRIIDTCGINRAKDDEWPDYQVLLSELKPDVLLFCQRNRIASLQLLESVLIQYTKYCPQANAPVVAITSSIETFEKSYNKFKNTLDELSGTNTIHCENILEHKQFFTELKKRSLVFFRFGDNHWPAKKVQDRFFEQCIENTLEVKYLELHTLLTCLVALMKIKFTSTSKIRYDSFIQVWEKCLKRQIESHHEIIQQDDTQQQLSHNEQLNFLLENEFSVILKTKDGFETQMWKKIVKVMKQKLKLLASIAKDSLKSMIDNLTKTLLTGRREIQQDFRDVAQTQIFKLWDSLHNKSWDQVLKNSNSFKRNCAQKFKKVQDKANIILKEENLSQESNGLVLFNRLNNLLAEMQDDLVNEISKDPYWTKIHDTVQDALQKALKKLKELVISLDSIDTSTNLKLRQDLNSIYKWLKIERQRTATKKANRLTSADAFQRLTTNIVNWDTKILNHLDKMKKIHTFDKTTDEKIGVTVETNLKCTKAIIDVDYIEASKTNSHSLRITIHPDTLKFIHEYNKGHMEGKYPIPITVILLWNKKGEYIQNGTNFCYVKNSVQPENSNEKLVIIYCVDKSRAEDTLQELTDFYSDSQARTSIILRFPKDNLDAYSRLDITKRVMEEFKCMDWFHVAQNLKAMAEFSQERYCTQTCTLGRGLSYGYHIFCKFLESTKNLFKERFENHVFALLINQLIEQNDKDLQRKSRAICDFSQKLRTFEKTLITIEDFANFVEAIPKDKDSEKFSKHVEMLESIAVFGYIFRKNMLAGISRTQISPFRAVSENATPFEGVSYNIVNNQQNVYCRRNFKLNCKSYKSADDFNQDIREAVQHFIKKLYSKGLVGIEFVYFGKCFGKGVKKRKRDSGKKKNRKKRKLN